MRQSLNPLTYCLTGLDWQGRTGRAGLLVALAIMAGLIAALYAPEGTLPGWVEPAAILLLALWFVPFSGNVLRRLNDLGWSGWLWWLGVVPYVSIGFYLVLLILPSRVKSRFQAPGTFRGLGFGLACLVALLLTTRVFWEPYFIPAGSMKPALMPGDYVVAIKGPGTLTRGRVMLFRQPSTGQIMVDRVIGLPGDRVQMIDGVLHLNGQAAAQTDAGFFNEIMAARGPLGQLPRCANGAIGQGADCLKRRRTETLPTGEVADILDIGPMPMDNTALVTVPEGMLFVLGDNRDNSADSRIAVSAGGTGFVAVDDLRDRPWFVAFSARGTAWWKFWTWAPDRFLVGVK